MIFTTYQNYPLALNVTWTLTRILILTFTLPQTKHPIITLTLTICCRRYHRRSKCSWVLRSLGSCPMTYVLLITFRNVPLENVKKIKYLGVILDSGMTWGDHVSKIVGKISQAIGCIRRIKHLLSLKILKNLYFAMILPYIDYCSTSWGTVQKSIGTRSKNSRTNMLEWF